MKTYYTKCGREFEKSSTAGVTGHHIPDGDKLCEECPFRKAVNEGWPPVFKRWECRAGSQPPNQKDDWRGSLDDKNTIHIQSLHNDFLEAVLEYCKTVDDLGAGYNQDLEDCRRVISVNCSGNKKGIAAKKALIEKFFPTTDTMLIEKNCRTCANSKMFKTVNHAGSAGNCHKNGGSYPIYLPDGKCKDFKPKELLDPDWPNKNITQEVKECNHCEDCKHSVDEGESVEYIKCSRQKRFVTKKQKACEKFEPWEKHLCLECLYCRRSEKAIDHPASYKCFRASHRNGQDWYFSVDSIACSNFKSSPISCSNCQTDRTTCGSMYPSDYMYKDMKPCNMYTSQMTQKRYVDTKTGRLIFVSAGLGGEDYMTMYQDAGKWNSGGMHRLKSKDLPIRNTQEEAQADLDGYAAKKGWKVACEMSMGCGPVENVKCRINRNGWCNRDTASFEDMDAEASKCGFIRFNDRYLIQKYGVPFKDFNCGNCSSFTHSNDTHGTCSIHNEERYEGAKACHANFVKRDLNAESKEANELKCTKYHCPFNNDEISECGFDPAVDDAHQQQMEEAKDEFHCTNKQLLETLESLQTHVTTYNDRVTLLHRIDESKRCISNNVNCVNYVKHNEGCSLHVMNGNGLLFWLKNKKYSKCDCEVYEKFYRELVTGANKQLDPPQENMEDIVMELVKPEDDPAPAAAFDYSTVDTETATFLQEKEQKITQIRMMSVMAIGKELKEVHGKLANNRTGTFQKWCKNIGISDDTANRYIRAYEYITANCGNIEDADNIQTSLLFAISKTSAPPELQKAVLEGDITTHKQYKELESKLRKISEELAKKDEELKCESDNSSQILNRMENRIKKAEQDLKAREQEAQLYKQSVSNLQQQLVEANKSGDKGVIDILQKQLTEAKRQVEILTDELMKPMDIEPAVVEKVPADIEQELDDLRNKTSLRQDYNYIADILGKLLTSHPGMLKNWAKVAVQENSITSLQGIRGELINLTTTIETMIDYLDEEIQMK